MFAIIFEVDGIRNVEQGFASYELATAAADMVFMAGHDVKVMEVPQV